MVAGSECGALQGRIGLPPLRTAVGLPGREIHGNKRHDYPPIKVGDVDLAGGKIVLRDTKNRSDHVLLLSRQALEIVRRNCEGRDSDEPLFAIVDARKTLAWINAKAETKVQGHGLRATFACIAAELDDFDRYVLDYFFEGIGLAKY